jgi:hypothetical protein
MMAQKSQEEFQGAQIQDMEARRKLDESRYGLEQRKFALEEGSFGLDQRKLALDESAYGLEEKKFKLAEGEYGLKEQGLTLEQQRVAEEARKNAWEQQVYKKTRALEEDKEQREMGIKAAGMGMSLFGSKMLGGGGTLGDLGNKVSGLWSSLFGSSQIAPGTPKAPPFSTTGPISGLDIGASIAGGAMGFGAGKMFGGRNKLKSSLIGAGVGGLASYLGGGQSLSSSFGGALLGGLGGLF